MFVKLPCVFFFLIVIKVSSIILSYSPHILPLSTEPGLQDRKAFLLSRDLGSATIISEDT